MPAPYPSQCPSAARLLLVALAVVMAALAADGGRSAAMPYASPDQPAEVCSREWVRAMHPAPPRDAMEVLGAGAAASVYLEPIGSPAANGRDQALPGSIGLAAVVGAAMPSAEIQGLAQNLVRPNDTFFTGYQRQRYFEAGVLDAWQTTFGARDVTIAIVADGVDVDHPDLDGKIWRNAHEIAGNGVDDDGNGYVDDVGGWDVADNDGDPRPIELGELRRSPIHVANRGTMMAGIAAAESHNGLGITGVAWGARIMPIKVFREYRDDDDALVGIGTYTYDQVEAICYAANNGADVILLGGFFIQDPNNSEQLRNLPRLQAAIRYAHDAGAVVIAGAGECGTYSDGCPKRELYGENPTMLPAGLEGVLGVQSSDGKSGLRSEASYGPWVDLVAPGQDMMTTVNTENDALFEIIQGRHPRPSDFAAAFVAGTVGLLLSADHTLSPFRIEQQLCRTAKRDAAHGAYEMVGGVLRNERYGCGVLDAEAAVVQMPWRVKVDVQRLDHFVQRDELLPRIPIGNERLNAHTWDVREDVNWLWDEPLLQRAGTVARHDVILDLDALRSYNNNRLSAGDVIRTRLRVCPNNPQNPIFHDESDCAVTSGSGCHCLDYAVHVVETLSRVYLPSATW